MLRLNAAGIRCIPTGIAHGTITAIIPSGPVEITTLRRDVSTDGRRATVAFADDWQDDAARRDFTINALYADPLTNEIFDYFGGLDDLAERRVRFIGNAAQRIREDHLRILRYFRFQARFGSQPADQEAEQSCGNLAIELNKLSSERIGMELLYLLALPDPASTVTRMAQLDILAVILPEANPPALSTLISEEQRQAIGPDPLRRLAALLPADTHLANTVAARFRLSGAQKKRLTTAAQRSSGTTGAPHALIYRLGLDEALDRLLLSGGDTAGLSDWVIPTFPLKGGQIIARGVKAGPEVTRILQTVENRWINESFPDECRVSIMLDEELNNIR
jgi:poly(A) polymerase